jgi:LysR family transcriptional regulator, low CO2-responsive transcriptional regulator
MYEKWLKAFHMVATQGGFTAAARALNVGQPTISTHIKTLEDYFRVELFFRRGRSVELTDIGRQLLAITQGLYGHEAEAVSFLRTVGQNDRGRVRLGAVGPYDVIELVDAFRKRYPRIELAVNVAPRSQIVAGLTAYEIDVGVLADDIASPDFHSMLYSHHPVVVAVHRRHRLAGRKQIRLADLRDEEVVLRDAPSATRRAFDDALARAKVPINPIMVINSRESVREAIARGMGIGFVSAREFAPHPSIRLLRVADADISIGTYVACLSARRQRPLIAAVLDTAEAVAERRR